jgi:hypothetical protein
MKHGSPARLLELRIVQYVVQYVRKVTLHVGYGTVRYVGLVVGIAVAVAVCCCFAVFSC